MSENEEEDAARESDATSEEEEAKISTVASTPAARTESDVLLSMASRFPLVLARDSSGGFVAAAARGRRRTASETSTRSHRAAHSGTNSAMSVGELIAQLQRLWQRQRFRADERAFMRDIERIVAQLKQRGPVHTAVVGGDTGSADETSSGVNSADEGSGGRGVLSAYAMPFSSSHTMPPQHFIESSSDSGDETAMTPSQAARTPPCHRQHAADVSVETLLNAMEALFRHRYQEVRTLAFDVVNLCLTNYGDQLTDSTRVRIFQQLEDHDQGGDFEQRQKTLRLLTRDGRYVEPFHVELGWLLLQWLEESDEQRDLLSLIQNTLRRSPLTLDFETVIAITSVICGRCDVAWSRGDVETCKRFLSFFHVLATHRLEHALGTSVCLRTLCWMVNADGQGTWSVMKHLLNSSSGFQVLRGLVNLLENPRQYNQWILRGAVFFVGMSCWGSQRVARLDEIKWAPVLLALETCLQCDNGVVVFEIILAIQRLVKKYGDSKPNTSAQPPGSNKSPLPLKRLVVEWDIILRMFRALRPWLSKNEGGSRNSTGRRKDGNEKGSTTVIASKLPAASPSSHKDTEIPVHMTRIPKELLDTLHVVVDLVREGKFSGEVEEFYDVLQEYFVYLSEPAVRLLLRYKAEAAHPAHHIDWLHTLGATMEKFFVNRSLPLSVREEALELLQVNLWSSRNVCEDRVIEEVLLPMLGQVYDDPEPSIRRKALDLITEVARTLESVRFDSLLDILESAIQLSRWEDSQLCAVKGVVSLFSSYFNHLPQSRALRMYDIITSTVESHRNWQVRHCALQCLLRVCEASADFRLQWKDHQVRTSRFLFCSRVAVRNQQTGAFVSVSRGLRAFITLISTETHSTLFRMAVEGLRRMLHNRVILTDIDINDTATKIISCVDYHAFGRAAIPDEISSLMAELEAGTLTPPSAPAHQAHTKTGLGGESRVPDSGHRLASSHASFRVNVSAVKSSLPDAAALLCKTRFTTMGLQILEQFVSYIDELNAGARHQLMVCIVGALDSQLLLTEQDLSAPTADRESSSEHSGSAWLWTARPRSSSWIRNETSATPKEDADVQAPAQASGNDATSYAESKPVSPHVAFTSRVLSKLQSSAHHFSALKPGSSAAAGERRSTSADATAAANAAHQRELLLKCLRLLFEAEFTLLHTATNAISILGHIVPDVVSARLDMLLRSARLCFYTPDGVFRDDGYLAVLEMVGNIVVSSPAVIMTFEHKLSVIQDLVLVAFHRHVDKATSYLAYRVLCEVVFRCREKEHRVTLAATALPLLRECSVTAITDHSLVLAEAAIDFIMSFALTRSDLVQAPALRITSQVDGCPEGEAQRPISRRSWVYHNAIISIEMRGNKPDVLVVRRASSTTRWHLAMHQDYIPELTVLDSSAEPRTRTTPSAPLVPTEGIELKERAGGDSREGDEHEEMRVDEKESRYHAPPPRPPKQGQPVAKSVAPEMLLWKSRAAAASSIMRGPKDRLEKTAPTLRHLPVPPLPAYDGIGGSPSFFCDPAPTVGDGSGDAMEAMLLDDPATRFHEAERSVPGTPEGGGLEACGTSDDTGPLERTGSPATEFSVSPSVTDQSDELAGTSTLSHETLSNVVEKSGRATKKLLAEALKLPGSTHPIDPLFMMMQLFDLNVEDRPQPLTDGASLALGLSVLDRTPEFETHKIGVLYLRSNKQRSEVDILGNVGGSLKYLNFLRALGTVTSLEGLHGYAGGMDTSSSHGDGKCMLLYRSYSLQMVFHVATMMNTHAELEKERQQEATSQENKPRNSIKTMKKKRHIGNDFVHIVFKECDEEYDVQTFSGQFNDVHIIVQPLNDEEYRTQVKCKPGIAPFGPLFGTQIIPSAIVAQCVRQTCLNANLACHAFHQELIGFTMNCEERLKQIKQLGARHATSVDEWTLDPTTEQSHG